MTKMIDAKALKQDLMMYGLIVFADMDLVTKAIKIVNRQLEVDAVPVVRCKYCKWYGDNWVSKLGSLCMNTDLKQTCYSHLWVDPDFYCGYGERLEHGTK
jgi:hypothetical protein